MLELDLNQGLCLHSPCSSATTLTFVTGNLDPHGGYSVGVVTSHEMQFPCGHLGFRKYSSLVRLLETELLEICCAEWEIWGWRLQCDLRLLGSSLGIGDEPRDMGAGGGATPGGPSTGRAGVTPPRGCWASGQGGLSSLPTPPHPSRKGQGWKFVPKVQSFSQGAPPLRRSGPPAAEASCPFLFKQQGTKEVSTATGPTQTSGTEAQTCSHPQLVLDIGAQPRHQLLPQQCWVLGATHTVALAPCESKLSFLICQVGMVMSTLGR